MYLSTSLLAANDYVGMSYWLATDIMLASTVFFFVERGDEKGKWKTSMTVAGLVTGIAFLALPLHERTHAEMSLPFFVI